MIEPSKALMAARAIARGAAADRRQRFVTIEHLLYGVTRTAEGAAMLRYLGGDPDEMARELEEYIELLPSGQPREPQNDEVAGETFRRALVQAHVSGRPYVEIADLVVHIIEHNGAYASLLFHAAGIERFALIRFAAHGDVGPAELPQTAWLTVRFHNDHFTTMEFVVHVLTTTYRMAIERAHAFMLQVHQHGYADVTTLKRADALERTVEALELAEKVQLPLRITLERAE